MHIESKEFVLSQFLSCSSLKEYNWKPILKCLTWEEQGTFLLQCVKHPLALRLPIKFSYQLAFLKEIIDYMEKEHIEIHDDIYSTYCGLLARSKQKEDFCYKHYIISDKNAVSLKVSSKLISDGTTGLHIWEASFILSEWCLQNKDVLKDKVVLELGSGPGMTGLTVAKCCQPKEMWLTDCHPSVLELLEENVILNFGNTQRKIIKGANRVHFHGAANSNSEIGILNLPWEDLQKKELLKRIVVPDIIVGADLVYDSSLFQALCTALRYFLRTNTKCQIIFVCTVRNPDTLTEFLTLLESHSLDVTQIAIPSPIHLYWSQSIEARMFAINQH